MDAVKPTPSAEGAVTWLPRTVCVFCSSTGSPPFGLYTAQVHTKGDDSRAQYIEMTIEAGAEKHNEKRRRKYTRVGAQLERKRVQDRAAQQAFRQRTKDTIAQQETEIADCKSATAHLRLQLQAAQSSQQAAQEKADHLNQELERILNTLRMLTRPYEPQFTFSRSGLDLDSTLSTIPGSSRVVPNAAQDGPLDPQVSSFRLPPMSQVSNPSGQLHGRSLPSPGTMLASIKTTTGTTEMLMETPIFCESTCALDTILLNFLCSQRSMVAMGHYEQASGPPEPNLARLSDLTSCWPLHALTRVISDINAKFDVIRGIPEKTAVHWTFHHLLRWQIHPTQQNYLQIVPWLRPRPCQLQIPHPPWMTLVPWPEMREVMIRDYQSFHQHDFFLPYTLKLSLNWTGENCLSADIDEAVVRIKPSFERHISDLDNWSLGTCFLQAFPKLEGTFIVKD